MLGAGPGSATWVPGSRSVGVSPGKGAPLAALQPEDTRSYSPEGAVGKPLQGAGPWGQQAFVTRPPAPGPGDGQFPERLRSRLCLLPCWAGGAGQAAASPSWAWAAAAAWPPPGSRWTSALAFPSFAHFPRRGRGRRSARGGSKPRAIVLPAVGKVASVPHKGLPRLRTSSSQGVLDHPKVQRGELRNKEPRVPGAAAVRPTPPGTGFRPLPLRAKGQLWSRVGVRLHQTWLVPFLGSQALCSPDGPLPPS